MKVLVLGSTGMIGHKIHQVLSCNKGLKLFNISKSKLNNETIILDLRKLDLLRPTLQKIKPDVVVNAAGILIEDSELNALNSVKLNALLPLALSTLSKELKFRLIQISTDCVFSGNNGPYRVLDAKEAYSVYGKTKSLGEVFRDENLTIRTSVIGPDLKWDGKELFNWFMSQKGIIDGYTRSIWSGVTTLELAKCIESCVANDAVGLHHLSSGTSISKYNLLKIINEEFGNRVSINAVDGPVNNKVLINDDAFFYEEPQDYKDLIKSMKADIFLSKLYPHYH